MIKKLLLSQSLLHVYNWLYREEEDASQNEIVDAENQIDAQQEEGFSELKMNVNQRNKQYAM